MVCMAALTSTGRQETRNGILKATAHHPNAGEDQTSPQVTTTPYTEKVLHVPIRVCASEKCLVPRAWTTLDIVSTKRANRGSTRRTDGSVVTIYQGGPTAADILVEQPTQSTRELCCLEGEIRQVLSNLVGIATDAMTQKQRRLRLCLRKGRDCYTLQSRPAAPFSKNGKGSRVGPLVRTWLRFYSGVQRTWLVKRPSTNPRWYTRNSPKHTLTIPENTAM